MTCLLALFWRGVEELSLRKMHTNLKRLLAGQEVVQVADPDLDASFKSLSGKLNLLTEALQKAENHSLTQEEEIIEKERKRIARGFARYSQSGVVCGPHDFVRRQSAGFEIG